MNRRIHCSAWGSSSSTCSVTSASFTVRRRRAVVSEPGGAVVAAGERVHAHDRVTPATPRGRVLIVDDDPGVLDVLSEMVEALHYVSERVETADAGLTAMATFNPDVVLLDLAMPGLSGVDALPLFRRQHPNVPVIVVTAVIDPVTLQQVQDQGAFDTLSKPFQLPALERMLADAMRQRAGG